MRCETCKAERVIRFIPTIALLPLYRTQAQPLPRVIPCPDCGGCGVQSCCDGAVGSVLEP